MSACQNDLPLWSTWTSSIPRRPMCCDQFEHGMWRRPLGTALAMRYIEFNHPHMLWWLIYDHDRSDSFESWERAKLPPPNLYVRNPANGHGHLYYALRQPVGLAASHRKAPIRFAAAVQRGMTRRLGSDAAYANRFAKNPANVAWRTTWHSGSPYSLEALFSSLDPSDVRAVDSGPVGIGRNCDLFDQIRRIGYESVLPFKAEGGTRAQFAAQLASQTSALNREFSHPLPSSEVRSIANSSARWIWREFTAEKFSRIQSARARRPRGGQHTAATVLEARHTGESTSKISKKLGLSRRTVRRHGATPRGEYEAEGLLRLRPWDADGMSRAAWYRRRPKT